MWWQLLSLHRSPLFQKSQGMMWAGAVLKWCVIMHGFKGSCNGLIGKCVVENGEKSQG